MMSANGMLKPFLRRVFGEQFSGMLDYWRRPTFGREKGLPLNGQMARQVMFRSLMERVSPVAIVETGTCRGATTEYFSAFGLPVFSIEANPRFYGYARVRLRRCRYVNLLLGDSRSMLRRLFSGALQDRSEMTIFFYLDAHWNDDLPLAEELGIVFRGCSRAVVMIDDFQVPFDPGYGYDDYGPGKALTSDYIAAAVAQNSLCAFYPATPAAHDSGARRGCIVLAKNDVHGLALTAIDLLRAA